MRKHFLILMLMALLPLAGWAAPISGTDIQANSPYYGYLPRVAGTGLQKGTDFEILGYYDGDNVVTANQLSEAQVKATNAGVTLYALVHGLGDYEGNIMLSFQIKKMPLVLTGTAGTKPYDGTATPAALSPIYTISTVKEDVEGGVYLTSTLSSTITVVRESGVNVGEYALSATSTNSNYTIASTKILTTGSAQAFYSITTRDFVENTTTGLTINVSGNLTFNGSAQKATVTVYDNGLKKSLSEASYYTAEEAIAYNAGLENSIQAGTPAPANTVYGFASYGDNGGANHYADGRVIVTGHDDTYTTVLVTENIAANENVQNAADFVGHVFKIQATSVDDNYHQLLATNGTPVPGAGPGQYIYVKMSNPSSTVYTATDAALYNALLPGAVAEGGAYNGDYYLIWENNTAAGNATVTVKGMGNYKQGNIAAKQFTIKRATLIVTPSATKVYDGVAGLNGTTVDYTYQGWVAETQTVTVNATTAEPTVANAKKDVDSYTLTVNAAGFTTDNYQFYANPGTFSITKKTVKVKAPANQEINYGEAENYVPTLEDNVDADETAIKDAVKITRGNIKDNQGKYTLTPSWKTEAEIDADESYYAAIDAEVEADQNIQQDDWATEKAARKAARKDAAKAVLNNYKMNAVNGKVKINNAELRIALKESEYTLTKVYDGQDISLATPTKDELMCIGLQEGDENKVNIDDITLTVTPINGSIKNQGTYQIVLDGVTAPNYDIIYIPSQYKITKRPLKLTIANQTFVKGTTPNIAFNYVVDVIKVNNQPIADQGIVDGEKAEDIFKLQFAAGTVTVDAQGKINNNITQATDYANAIEAVLKLDANNNTNYDITTYAQTKGTATVLPAASLLLTGTTDLSTLNNTNNVSVTFGSRQLKARVWTAMVLPFKATVREISNALGYAVVDKFVADNTSADMNFKIFMGEIPAYTPFLVKTDEDVNLNNVVFDGVNIVKLTDANKGNLTQSNSSYSFIGTSKSEILTGTFWAISTDMTETNFEFTMYENSSATATEYTYPSMRAIIRSKDGSNNAPRIFIEEPDGSTTAINAINADGEVVKAEGWYTINGVKLQGMPTQKGLYINNGKKVVIK